MRIGLIGAENFHSKAFAQIFNGEKLFDGFSVTAICGSDDPAKRDELAKEYKIENCFETEAEVINSCDAVMITYRRGAAHMAPAVAALMAGKPVFVDKPFTQDVAQAQQIIKAHEITGTPFCGGSTLKELPQIAEFKKLVKPGAFVTIDYNADPESVFGGWHFYGAHSAELAMFLCGEDHKTVTAVRTGSSVSVNLTYADKQCLILTSPIKEELDITVSTDFSKHINVPIGDAYRYEASRFVEMIKTGKMIRPAEYYLDTVKLINKIVESYSTLQ